MWDDESTRKAQSLLAFVQRILQNDACAVEVALPGDNPDDTVLVQRTAANASADRRFRKFCPTNSNHKTLEFCPRFPTSAFIAFTGLDMPQTFKSALK